MSNCSITEEFKQFGSPCSSFCFVYAAKVWHASIHQEEGHKSRMCNKSTRASFSMILRWIIFNDPRRWEFNLMLQRWVRWKFLEPLPNVWNVNSCFKAASPRPFPLSPPSSSVLIQWCQNSLQRASGVKLTALRWKMATLMRKCCNFHLHRLDSFQEEIEKKPG